MFEHHPNVLVFLHPALQGVTGLSGKYEFSLESASLLNNKHSKSWHVPDELNRTLRQKSYYGTPMVDSFGILTPEGAKAGKDANLVMRSLIAWYPGELPSLADPRTATLPEEVLVCGSLTPRHLQVLSSLAILKKSGIVARSQLVRSLAYPAQDGVVTYKGAPYVTTDWAPRRKFRRECEKLAMFGFLSYVDMPRDPSFHIGRGKVGGCLSPWGERLLELVAYRLDEGLAN